MQRSALDFCAKIVNCKRTGLFSVNMKLCQNAVEPEIPNCDCGYKMIKAYDLLLCVHCDHVCSYQHCERCSNIGASDTSWHHVDPEST